MPRFTVLTFWFLCCCTAPLYAQDVPPELQIYDQAGIAQDLMALEKSQEHEKVFKLIRDVANGDELKEALLWLRTRVMSDDNADPRYALTYAESLLRVVGDRQEDNMPLMETSAMVYLYGHLTLAVDAQGCINRESSWNNVTYLLEPFEKLTAFYKNLPEHKRRDILTVAMRLEDRVSERKPNTWICSDPELPENNTGYEEKKDGMDRVESELMSLMQDLDLQPKFVSSRIWRERRNATRRTFARQFR